MHTPTTGAVYLELSCNSDANILSCVIYVLLCAAYCRLMKLHAVALCCIPRDDGFLFCW